MKITLYGAAKEVGRSCIVVENDTNKFMLDCGIKFSKHGNEYPLHFEVSEIDAAFISHAHLDHTGALPLFNSQGLNCPIFTTSETKEITRILLKDSLHIEMLNGEFPHYEEEHIFHVLGAMHNVYYREEKTFEGITYQFFDAGHIPGSASILLNVDGNNILYTGDIQVEESELLNPADLDYGKDIDVLICESTYGLREHPKRIEEEKTFLEEVERTIQLGGSVLVPVFGVGRAQEVILMLSRLHTDVPIYLDGMAKKVTDLFLQKPKFLKDSNDLRNAKENVTYVKGRHMRNRIVNQQSIVVSTSGMMTGGPIMFYTEKLKNDTKSSILLTGYQADGTNGRSLLERGMIKVDGRPFKIKCKVSKFDFSAHAGLRGLKDLIKKINPKVLLLNHGDLESEDNLASWARQNNFDVKTLELGESYNGA